MILNIEKLQREIRTDTIKIVISTLVAAAALMGAGVALGNYMTTHNSSPAAAAPPTTPRQ